MGLHLNPEPFGGLLSLGALVAPKPSSTESQARLLEIRSEWGHCLWGCQQRGGVELEGAGRLK